MNEMSKTIHKTQDLEKPVVVPAEAYISRDYARAEQDRLFRKVWLQAGRVEDLRDVGELHARGFQRAEHLGQNHGRLQSRMLLGAFVLTSQRDHQVDVRVRTRDHVHAEHFAHATGCFGACVDRGGATNSPAAVYAVDKAIQWLQDYSPPSAMGTAMISASGLAMATPAAMAAAEAFPKQSFAAALMQAIEPGSIDLRHEDILWQMAA